MDRERERERARDRGGRQRERERQREGERERAGKNKCDRERETKLLKCRFSPRLEGLVSAPAVRLDTEIQHAIRALMVGVGFL